MKHGESLEFINESCFKIIFFLSNYPASVLQLKTNVSGLNSLSDPDDGINSKFRNVGF
jgi:hypothetical protein